MSGEHHETLSHGGDDIPLPSPRSTGLVFAGAAAVAAVLLRAMPVAAGCAAAASCLFLALALAAPSWLAGLNRAWFRLALAMNKVVSPVVMLVLFWTTIVPFGLAMQMRRDPLRARRRAGQRTYWIDRPAGDRTGSMRNQF